MIKRKNRKHFRLLCMRLKGAIIMLQKQGENDV